MASELLDIRPRELKFTFELRKQSSCSIQLFNKSNHYVAFKVKTTSPKSYCVRPNVGVVKPKTTCEFTVTMQAQKTAPPDLECKDKFLVQSVLIPFGSKEEDHKSNLFSNENGGFIEENKLRVVFVTPPYSRQSLVLQSIDGGLNQSRSLTEGPKPREQGTSAHNSALNGIENLHPAYVKTTSPKSYCVRPNVGVVAPKTTCEFTVTMQAQKTAPPDLECKDKFLVQSVVIPFGSKEEDLKSYLFSKGNGGFIEENKLRVVLVTPPDSHQSLVLQLIDGGLNQSPPLNEGLKPREQGTSAHNSALNGIENLHPAYVAKFTDVENLRAKLMDLESKLNEAQKSILQLWDEKISASREEDKLRQEALLLRRKYAAGARLGFPALLVCFVALVALTLGCSLHS